jgi:acyl carrier protein
MTEDMLTGRVRAVLAQAFEIDPDQLPAEPDTENVEKWDSLGHLALIEELEAEFATEIPHAVAVELLSQADIVARLRHDIG